MSRTESNTTLALGATAPDFHLLDVRSGRMMTRDEVFASHPQGCPRLALLVLFVSVHCPYVKHVEEQIGTIAREFFGAEGEGPLAIAAINSNDTSIVPEDAPNFMYAQADRCGWRFPYFVDPTQNTARAYDAACTPDVYLFDRDRKLVYHGQIDSTRPKRSDGFGDGLASTGQDLRAAILNLFAKQPPLQNQVPSLGCSIKWSAN